MVTVVPKKGNVSEAYFTKEFQSIGGEYAATQPQRYLKTQVSPGFGRFRVWGVSDGVSNVQG
jgi:hypothetical protein